MNRRNSRLLMTLALLGGAQMHIGCPGLEYAARAANLKTLVCNETGVDENDEAAICEGRKRADAERADCAQNISCKPNGAT
jgi:hypothetical protein